MKGRLRDEKGALIVEASIVFPVMFLVIFLMIFAGNAYLQKCRIEAIINKLSIEGAAYCADPMLSMINERSEEDSEFANEGNIPGFNVNVKPYRYLIGGMNDIISEIDGKVQAEVSQLSSGLFSGMKPADIVYGEPEFNNGFIYSTFSIEISYNIIMPIRLLGDTENILMAFSTRVDVPVTDSPEFIRNVDMIEDYLGKYGITDWINEKVGKLMEKVNEWKNKE